jgi:4,5-dihydroxyphthalate decarboxylase
LPVFPSRAFRHSFIAIHEGSGIRSPKDLAGKRIGVPLYTMTAAIWIRGFLANDHGVDLSGVTWVQGSINSASSHGSPSVMPMHRPVPIELNHSGKSLSELLDTGEIDAIMGTTMPDCMKHNPRVVRLFPQFRQAEKAYYQRTQIFPIMHTVVIRREVYEANRWIAQSLTKAFIEAQKMTYEALNETAALKAMLPHLTAYVEETKREFGDDWWAYGLEKNIKTLETFTRYHHEQGLSAKKLEVSELFAPEALEAFKI